MRIQSYSYGNSVFDVRREFQNSRSKTKKLIVYFVLSSFVIYLVKFVLKLNSMVFMDVVRKAIHGEPININSDYIINMSQGNKIVAFLFSAYYFMEKNLTTAKEHILLIIEKIPKTN
ncbi:hypothetical protein [Clostridium sporogenes]|uniref:hypothetical protein n=1 Tax=Clostridium sporogenes TaxID=1509 RepID=UPI00071765F6|nr:hypothetical protein [Clostridium sporogenes]KRU40060.1 hypothetical protein VT94_25370 [Clostridium sporogenes]MBY7065200.1 hypothetical protein [Clostridium sporogenes]MBY7071830.1 hypothetical protein [Clostridium sporogenes]MCW6064730.1 hypothetical protein [Clostridium sporogenes]OQP88542.1 hypothetical protein VT93_0201860 [Clostridium sporogenes]